MKSLKIIAGKFGRNWRVIIVFQKNKGEKLKTIF